MRAYVSKGGGNWEAMHVAKHLRRCARPPPFLPKEQLQIVSRSNNNNNRRSDNNYLIDDIIIIVII